MILLTLLLKYLIIAQIALQNFHTTLFKKLHKKIVIKLKFLSIGQNIISKLHFKLVHSRFYKRKLKKIQNNDYIIRGSIPYKFSKKILTYIINNNIETKEFIKDLEPDSKELVKKVLDRIFYIYIHTLIDKKEVLTPIEINMKSEIENFIISIQNEIKLPIDRYEVSVFYYDCGLKLLPPNIILSLKNKDFIDGGAFIGDSSLILERNYDPYKIYAFEPELENFNLLLTTIKRNKLKKVIPINKAIGEKIAIMKIKSAGGSSNISTRGKLSMEVETIDSFASQNKLNVGLIKMDIEGFALNALKGAEKTIKTFSPVLIISIYHNGKEFFESMSYIKNINPRYNFIIRKLNPLSSFLETTLIGWVN